MESEDEEKRRYLGRMSVVASFLCIVTLSERQYLDLVFRLKM